MYMYVIIFTHVYACLYLFIYLSILNLNIYNFCLLLLETEFGNILYLY